MAPLDDLPDHHDLAHLRDMLPHIHNRRCAVDGGAHRGIWTRELARHFQSVIAFEPEPVNFARLQADCPPNASPRNMALGDRRMNAPLLPGPENTGQWHLGEPGEWGMPVVPLDDMEFQCLDFIKLDVEGYELFALRGADKTIDLHRPSIMVERCGRRTPLHAAVTGRYGYEDEAIDLWLRERAYRLALQRNKDYLYLPEEGA